LIDYPAILIAVRPGELWELNGDDYDGLTWLSDTPKPSREELDAAWPQVQHDRAVAAVYRDRQAAYQTESDPLFLQSQRPGEGVTIDDWLEKVAEIKARYPLPE